MILNFMAFSAPILVMAAGILEIILAREESREEKERTQQKKVLTVQPDSAAGQAAQ